MPHIFLSYERSDQKQARRVAEALEQAGFDVWWDANLTPGAKFRQEIAARLRDAACVVVLWSSTSINSDFVIDEAEDGRRRGVLVQAVLDAVEPPHGFRQVQWADLQWWTGGIEGLRHVIQGISRHVLPSAVPPPPSEVAADPLPSHSRSKKRRKSESGALDRPDRPTSASHGGRHSLELDPASGDDFEERIVPPVGAVSSTRPSFREPPYGQTTQGSPPFVPWAAMMATMLLGVTVWTFLDGPEAPSWLMPVALTTIALTSVGAFKLFGGRF